MPRPALTDTRIREGLDDLKRRHPDFRRALRAVGYPPLRRAPGGFPTLTRIVVGQQLSTKAAATIFNRLEAAAGELSPEAILRMRKASLRKAGLSERKVEYIRGLARAMRDGELDERALRAADDGEVVAAIAAMHGFGEWSAHMYLIFALRRPDVWPVGDLGVRAGVGRILDLPEVPTVKETRALGDAWRPHRTAVALLAWHYLHNAPVD